VLGGLPDRLFEWAGYGERGNLVYGAWARALRGGVCGERCRLRPASRADNEDLKDLGVDRLADRKTLLKAIAGLAEGRDEAGAEPSASTAITGERRQVTVLFADLAGYTKLSSELGAEATHALLNRYFEAVDGIIEGYGGSVDKHIGDNVMAEFDAPIAHGDDPLRTVRAALTSTNTRPA